VDVSIRTFGICVFIIVVFMFISTGIVRAEPDQMTGPVKPGQKKADRRVDWGIWIQDYKWAEYSEDGSKLLEETGFLYTLAYDFEGLDKYIGLRNGVNLFFGQVDYDGQTWSGIPVKTDVLYIGTKMYLDAVPNYRLDSGLLLKAFIGIGGRWWFRDIDDTRTEAGEPVRGSEEWWWCVYGRLGAGTEYPVSRELDIFTEAGVKMPVYARNDANLYVIGAPSASLEPDQDISVFGNIGIRWKQLAVKFAYDSLRFDRSDKVTSGTFELYQPKSKADIYSLEVYWSRRF
jgi:hypothetical protein